jgi:hypothetical protein
VRGIEPGSPRWESGVVAIRPRILTCENW